MADDDVGLAQPLPWIKAKTGLWREMKLISAAAASGETLERVHFIYTAVNESAALTGRDGAFEIDAGAIAYLLRCDADLISKILANLAVAGLIVDGRCLTYYPAKPKPLSSTERSQKRRGAQAPPNAKEPPVDGLQDSTHSAPGAAAQRQCNGNATVLVPSESESLSLPELETTDDSSSVISFPAPARRPAVADDAGGALAEEIRDLFGSKLADSVTNAQLVALVNTGIEEGLELRADIMSTLANIAAKGRAIRTFEGSQNWILRECVAHRDGRLAAQKAFQQPPAPARPGARSPMKTVLRERLLNAAASV